MPKETYLVKSSDRPDWFSYPHSFVRLIEQSLVNLKPWHMMKASEAIERLSGLSERYPKRKLFPFAYRQDNDDIACWIEGEGEKVYVIHDFSSPGWEDEAVYENLWGWFREAIEETIDWE